MFRARIRLKILAFWVAIGFASVAMGQPMPAQAEPPKTKSQASVAPSTTPSTPPSPFASASPSAASQAPDRPNSNRQQTIEEVRVVAKRLRSDFLAELAPEISFDRIEIDALGVSSLEEVLAELQPELNSGRGRGNGAPVILVNGQVIANRRDVRSFPPEAIRRVEIYPEEVALQYGFRATQKVINFVLEDEFTAVSTRASFGGAVQGGAENSRLEVGHVGIDRDRRLSINLDVTNTTALHDSDRSVISVNEATPASLSGNVFGVAGVGGNEIDPALSALAGQAVTSATLPQNTVGLVLGDLLASANSPEIANELDARTLIPEQRDLAFSASYAWPVGDRLSANVSAEYRRGTSEAEQGLGSFVYTLPADSPQSIFINDITINRALPIALGRDQDSDSYNLSATLAGRWGAWTWRWLNTFDEAKRRVRTAREVVADDFIDAVIGGDPEVNALFGPEQFEILTDVDTTENRDLVSRLLLRGELFDTRSGPVRGSVGFEWRSAQRDSETRFDGQLDVARLDRNTSQFSGNLDVPLWKMESGAELLLNSNVELANHSDFGSLRVVGGGLIWNWPKLLRLTASVSREEGVPGIQQLGDAITRIPNRRVFDFITGESVETTLVSGGNASLLADTRRVANLRLRLEPLKSNALVVFLDYLDAKTDDPITSFPVPNAQIEAAFSDRFVRDAQGTLIEFDARPINVASEQRREFTWGVRYSRSLRSRSRDESKVASGSQARQGAPAEVRRAIRRRGRADARRAGSSGRLRFALFHNITLEDELTIAPGIAPIDFVGVSNAGRIRDGARHLVTLRCGYSYKRFSARINVSWQASRTSLPGPNDVLQYDDLTRVNVNLGYTFAKESPLLTRFPALSPLLASARLRLRVENLFDAQPDVVSSSGIVPSGFARDELDPLGRAVYLELRKLFR